MVVMALDPHIGYDDVRADLGSRKEQHGRRSVISSRSRSRPRN